MNELLQDAIEAHGGMAAWERWRTLQVTIVTGGGLWGLKGLVQDPMPREMTVTLHEQLASVAPFGRPEWRSAYSPARIAIETASGTVLQERLDPRRSFAGHTVTTAWDPLHRAYFNGYALWSYLTTPFHLALPGVEVEEIAPWQEGDEQWRVLRIHYPDDIATHSRRQDFYFGSDMLLRRHDYQVDVAGSLPSAQYVHDIVDVEGLRFPTKRRAYARGPDLQPLRDLLLVSIDLSNFRLS
jgi:hypothetical protein